MSFWEHCLILLYILNRKNTVTIQRMTLELIHILSMREKKGKKTIYENKLKYEIPEAVFKDKNNWKTGDFYYKTGVKTIYGIIATITAGKSIFWKLSKK
jgi:hypothetical protein